MIEGNLEVTLDGKDPFTVHFDGRDVRAWEAHTGKSWLTDEDARLSLTTVAFIGWSAARRTGKFDGSWGDFDKVALDVAAPEVAEDEPGND